jgi:hypothetical protein
MKAFFLASKVRLTEKLYNYTFSYAFQTCFFWGCSC